MNEYISKPFFNRKGPEPGKAGGLTLCLDHPHLSSSLVVFRLPPPSPPPPSPTYHAPSPHRTPPSLLLPNPSKWIPHRKGFSTEGKWVPDVCLCVTISSWGGMELLKDGYGCSVLCANFSNCGQEGEEILRGEGEEEFNDWLLLLGQYGFPNTSLTIGHAAALLPAEFVTAESHDGNWIDCIMDIKIFPPELQSVSVATLQCSISVRLKPSGGETETDNILAFWISKPPGVCVCVSVYVSLYSVCWYIDMCMIYFQL